MLASELCSVARQQPTCFSGRVATGSVRRMPAAPSRRLQLWRTAAALPDTGPSSSSSSSSSEGGARRQPQPLQFVYQNEEAAAAAEAALQAAYESGMKEYEELKEWLLFRTWRFGLLLSGYLLLAVSAEAAVAELVGAAASYGYLRWLMWDVDQLQPGDRLAILEAEQIEQPLLRNIAKGFAAYSHALRPRLLVLCALVAACAAVDATDPADPPLGLLGVGCAVGGFLSYKVALLLKLYDDLKPKALSAEDLMRPRRPTLAELPGEDVTLDFMRSSSQRKDKEEEQQQQGGSSGGGSS